jgi:hypothetical protein
MTTLLDQMNDPFFREIFINTLGHFHANGNQDIGADIRYARGIRREAEKTQDKQDIERAARLDQQIQGDVGLYVKSAADMTLRVMRELHKLAVNQEEPNNV